MEKRLRSLIIKENDHLIFVNKPAGLLSIPDRFDQNKANIYQLLRYYYPEIIPIHRLDKFTSGVMVLAKNSETHKGISQLFEQRQVIKEYYALVYGHVEEGLTTIEVPIAENPSKKGSYITAKKGKNAKTTYEIVKKWGTYSLLKVKIYTGRTHQIRVHLSHVGCPLLVDPVYGPYSEFFLSQLKGKKFNLKKDTSERPLLDRTPLHSYKLSFRLPSSDQIMEVTAPYPKDMRAMIFQLDKLKGAVSK